MRSMLLAGLFALIAPLVAAQTVTVDGVHLTSDGMQPLPVQIGGRVMAQPTTSPADPLRQRYTHQWPAVYFEAAFEGTAVLLKFDDSVNEYRLIIDDLSPHPLAQPGKAEVTIADLPPGSHRVRLEKVTESIWMLGAFEGFFVASGATAGSVVPRPRQIEFIGDSDMTGYGLRSDTRVCTQEQVRLRSDAQSAYPALVAKHFNADYQLNAISGRGLVRNFEGMAPGNTMAAIYANTLPDETATTLTYRNKSWQPQIIVLGLGNNDFVTPLHPAEPWKTQASLIDSYVTGMAALLETLHRANPTATVLVHWPDRGILTEAEKTRLDLLGQSHLVQTAGRLGMQPVQFITMGDLTLDKLACDFHPSTDDHRMMAQWMIDYFTARPKLWAGQ